MTKKINTKLSKLIKYYTLINHNLIYDNLSINRYKNKQFVANGDKSKQLKKLIEEIDNIKNLIKELGKTEQRLFIKNIASRNY